MTPPHSAGLLRQVDGNDPVGTEGMFGIAIMKRKSFELAIRG